MTTQRAGFDGKAVWLSKSRQLYGEKRFYIRAYSWAMGALFAGLIVVGVLGLATAGWAWEFLHLVVAAYFVCAGLECGKDSSRGCEMVLWAGLFLTSIGVVFGATTALLGEPGLPLVLFYLACGIASFVAARYL